jgi:hypothetical protein
VADTGADILRGNGIGPLAKCADDHIFFRVPRSHMPVFNAKRTQWHGEIELHGGRQQEGGRLWYRGNTLPKLPNGSPLAEEFNEDCAGCLVI